MRSISGPVITRTALAAVLSLAVVGSACGKVNQLKGAKAYKAANAAYQTQDYRKAADLYQEAIADDPDIPILRRRTSSWANSFDNLWKPSKKGDPENDKLLEDAVKNYQLAADKLMASRRTRNTRSSASSRCSISSPRTAPTSSTTQARPSRSCRT